MTLRVFLGASE